MYDKLPFQLYWMYSNAYWAAPDEYRPELQETCKIFQNACLDTIAAHL